jgi:hypothetical protein
MERLHWSQLNAEYNADVYKIWRKEGCYGEIARRLGYRLRLVRASFPRSVRIGRRFQASLLIANDGFAAPYNRRDAELVLRNTVTGSSTVVRLKLDPRRWKSGRGHSVYVNAALPAGLRPGYYELLLSLPDPAKTLHSRPEYAIRLANVGTWEPGAGYNRLGIKIQVGGPMP